MRRRWTRKRIAQFAGAYLTFIGVFAFLVWMLINIIAVAVAADLKVVSVVSNTFACDTREQVEWTLEEYKSVPAPFAVQATNAKAKNPTACVIATLAVKKLPSPDTLYVSACGTFRITEVEIVSAMLYGVWRRVVAPRQYIAVRVADKGETL